MSIPRLFAIALIFVIATIAWFSLGASIVARTGEFDAHLSQEVAQLWGGTHEQRAPEVWVERPRQVLEQVADPANPKIVRAVTRTVIDRVPVPLMQSRIDVGLALDHRQKGLLWYDTYDVEFAARYRVRNPDAEPRTVVVQFAFPSGQAIYDNFQFRVNQQRATRADDLSQGLHTSVELPAGGRGLHVAEDVPRFGQSLRVLGPVRGADPNATGRLRPVEAAGDTRGPIATFRAALVLA